MNTRWVSVTLEPEMTSAEVAFLIDVIGTCGLMGAFVEIGTGAGGTLRALVDRFGDSSRLVVVDPMTYFPEQLATVRLNLQSTGRLESVDIRVMKSASAYKLARAREEVFDLVLLDGKHSESAVATDLRWAGLVAVGGVVCVHDYGAPTCPGVTSAVDRFVRTSRNFDMIGRCETLIALKKRAPDSSSDVVRREVARRVSCVRDMFRARRPPSYIDAYVEWETNRLQAGFIHQTLGEHARDDGEQDFAALLSLGLQPHHVVVDFGCGSLRLGRHLIPYLSPGHYWGLDITDQFFTRAATRLRLRAPRLHVLSRKILIEAAQAQPHVVLVAGVLQVVPQDRLRGFFGVLASLSGRHTQILATVLESATPVRRGRFGFRHTREQITEAAQAAGMMATRLRVGAEAESVGAASPVSRASLYLFTKCGHSDGVLKLPSPLEAA